MVQKYINEDKIDAEQEIQLYLMILDMQVKLILCIFKHKLHFFFKVKYTLLIF